MEKEIAALANNSNSILLIVVVVTFCVLVLLGGFIVAWKLLKIKKISKDGIMSEEEKKIEEEIIRKDADTIRLQNRILKDIVQQIDQIEYKEILAKQMKIVEYWVEKGILKMREIHLGMLIAKVGDKAANSHPSLKAYYNITDIVANRYTDRFRNYMRENGFVEMTEIEFQAYVQKRLEELFSYTEEIIDNGFEHDVLGVEELRDEQRRNKHLYAQMIMALFVECREVKRKAIEEIKSLQKKYAQIQRHYILTGEILEIDGCDDN
jgi:hypothetical protein